MNKKVFTLLALVCTILLVFGCKDPREKTIWDYIDGENATEDQYRRGIEMLHEDLIKHGYMKEHSCFQLDCYSNHQNTYADIDRVNKLVEGSK